MKTSAVLNFSPASASASASALAAALAMAACSPAFAQPSGSAGSGTGGGGESPPNFFEVQQYDQPFAGWLEPTLWTTYIGSSDRRYERFGEDLSRHGMWAHSLELEYGLTDRLTLGSYFDFVDPRGDSFRFAQARLLARYRFANRQELFVNPAIYFEYYLPNRAYGDQELEARFIADKDIGDFRVVVNPTLALTTTGDDRWHAPSIGLSGGVYWRRPVTFQPGLEYFAEYGPINDVGHTRQYLLPSVDIALTRNITWHIGAGFGVTRASDNFVVASQLRFEYNLVRPSWLFGSKPRR